MLVLSRQKNQSLKIGDSITVKILHINGNRVSIGIDAPDDVRVVRGELKPEERKQEGGEAA